MIVQAHKGPGQTFGELALKSNATFPEKVTRRAATVTTTQNTILVVMDKHNYRLVLDKMEAKQDEAKINFFR